MHPLSMLQCSFAQKQWYWQESPNVGYGHAFSQFFPTKPGLQATMHYSRYLQRVSLLKPGNWIRLIITWIAEYLNQFYIRTHKRVVLSNIYPAQHFDLYKRYEVKIMVGWTDQEVLYCNLSNIYSVLTSAFSKTNVKVIPTQSVLEDAWVQLIVNVCFIFV